MEFDNNNYSGEQQIIDTLSNRKKFIPRTSNPTGSAVLYWGQRLGCAAPAGAAYYEGFPIDFCSSANGTLRPCMGRIWSTASLSRSMLS